jgi:hypothetical protein
MVVRKSKTALACFTLNVADSIPLGSLISQTRLLYKKTPSQVPHGRFGLTRQRRDAAARALVGKFFRIGFAVLHATSLAPGLLRSTILFARWNRGSSWRRRRLSRARQRSFRPGIATMLAVLGAAMAVGWLLVKAANPSAVSNR